MNTYFIFHADPSHAWLEVNQNDIRHIGLKESDFSRYSYYHGNKLFLEEDQDAGVFIKAYKIKHGKDPIIKERYQDAESVIRSYGRLN